MMQHPMDLRLQLRANGCLLRGQINEVDPPRGRRERQIAGGTDGLFRMSGHENVIARQNLDRAAGQALQGVQQTLTGRIGSVEAREISGQCGEPLLVLGEAIEPLPGKPRRRFSGAVFGRVLQGAQDPILVALGRTGIEPDGTAFIQTTGDRCRCVGAWRGLRNTGGDDAIGIEQEIHDSEFLVM